MSREAWQRMLAHLSADELRDLDTLLHEHLAVQEALGELGLGTGNLVEQHIQGRICYRLEHSRCGKANCRCMQGGAPHGPYWHAYHYLTEPRTTKHGGRSHWRKEYLGKQRPAALSDAQVAAGGGSVDRALVERSAELEAALAAALEQGDLARVENLARLLPNGDEWRARIAAHAGAGSESAAAETLGAPDEQTGGAASPTEAHAAVDEAVLGSKLPKIAPTSLADQRALLDAATPGSDSVDDAAPDSSFGSEPPVIEPPASPAPPQPAPAAKPAKPLKYPVPLGEARVAAAYRTLKPGKRDKRHLTIGYGITLCGHGIERGSPALRTYTAEDCKICLRRAAKKRWTCKECGMPLLLAVEKRVCAKCRRAAEKARKARKTGAARRRPASDADRDVARPSRSDDWPRSDRLVIPRPGESPLMALDRVLDRERKQKALDYVLLGPPSPVPEDVIAGCEVLPAGVRYTFCTTDLGLLGQVRLTPAAPGRVMAHVEVAGHPDDPMTERRLARFTPIAEVIGRRIDERELWTRALTPDAQIRGPIVSAPAFRDPVDVAYTLMPCERCGATIAMLAHCEVGTLEDTARAMFEKIRELNVPAWIASMPIGEGPIEERPADLLKVWPEREPVQRLPPDTFNALLDALGAQHCHSTRP